jgi:type IV secretory pathway VirB4 component
MFWKKEQQSTQHHFESTQKYLEIDKIKDDVVFLKDGSLRAVLMMSSVNMELRSEQESASVVSMYQSMLNALSFPIQILVQSRRIDLTSYLATLDESASKQSIPLLKDQTSAYISFLKEILSNVNVMDKRFFVVVPYYPNVIGQQSKGVLSFLGIKKATQTGGRVSTPLNENIQNLEKRVQTITSCFSSVGLAATALPTGALIELFYACYNPETAGHEHIKSLGNIGASYITTREAVEKKLG